MAITYGNILNLAEQILDKKIEKEKGKIGGHDFQDALAMRTMLHTLKSLYGKRGIDEELVEDYIRDMLRTKKDGY